MGLCLILYSRQHAHGHLVEESVPRTPHTAPSWPCFGGHFYIRNCAKWVSVTFGTIFDLVEPISAFVGEYILTEHNANRFPQGVAALSLL